MTHPSSLFFDARAGNWEASCYPSPVRLRLAALVSEFGAQPGERILDVGTGPGVLIPYLRSFGGESGLICAMDVSFGMVRQAQKKLREPLNFVLQADAHFIPFKEGIFDRVICFAAFPHFEHQEWALREMGRVIRPGGGLVIAHLMSRAELKKHHDTHAAVAGHVLPEAREMAEWFCRSGFSSPDIVDMPGRYLARGIKL